MVYPGQIIDLSATNKVLAQTGNTEYLKYYRNLFKINYQITKGIKHASISGGKLLIKSAVPDGTEIAITASNRKDSIDGGTTPQKTIKLKVNANKKHIYF